MMLRQILILIVSALLLYFGYQYYSNTFCPKCCTPSVTSDSSIGAAATTKPLLFNWNEGAAITNDGFDKLRTEILSKAGEGEAIEITGHYFADEENNSSYEDLGKARAVSFGELLKEKRPDLVIIPKSNQVDLIPDAETTAFESVSYKWISNEESKQERVEFNELGEAKILFPFNSSDKIDSPEVDQYLDNLADQLKSDNSKKVYIVGFTDSLGEPGTNRRLSERRAKKIRDILKSKGIPHRQIITSGRGEADAIAPNTNESNRQLNRRVEIIVK